MAVVIELDVEIPDLAEVEVETPDTEVTPSSGETVLLVATPGPPGPAGPPGAGVQIFGETPAGIKNGSNTVFTTAFSFVAGTPAVYLNGLREFNTEGYTETAPNTITFIDPPSSADSVRVDYLSQ